MLAEINLMAYRFEKYVIIAQIIDSGWYNVGLEQMFTTLTFIIRGL